VVGSDLLAASEASEEESEVQQLELVELEVATEHSVRHPLALEMQNIVF
jgi:hypothetical protein